MKSIYRTLGFAFAALCLIISGVTAVVSTPAGISSAPADTSGLPPYNVSVYISEAMSAVAKTNWTGAAIATGMRK